MRWVERTQPLESTPLLITIKDTLCNPSEPQLPHLQEGEINTRFQSPQLCWERSEWAFYCRSCCPIHTPSSGGVLEPVHASLLNSVFRHVTWKWHGVFTPWELAISKSYIPGLCFCCLTREPIIEHLWAHHCFLHSSLSPRSVGTANTKILWLLVCDFQEAKRSLSRLLIYSVNWYLLDTYYVQVQPIIPPGGLAGALPSVIHQIRRWVFTAVTVGGRKLTISPKSGRGRITHIVSGSSPINGKLPPDNRITFPQTHPHSPHTAGIEWNKERPRLSCSHRQNRQGAPGVPGKSKNLDL